MQQEAIELLQKVDADKLPSLPCVLLHLLDACQDENVSFEQLADVIRMDPGLYIKVIAATKGGFSSKDSLEQALSQLGLNTINSIAITSSVQQFFSRSSQERSSFLKQHWYHSIFCACVAESLASLTGYKKPGEAWIAGLLHDAGQLIMEGAYPGKYTTAFAKISEDEYFHELEGSEFGTAHYYVGAGLLSKHDNNPFLADAILYHHEPIDKIRDAHPLVKILNIANLLTRDQYEENPETAITAAVDMFGLDEHDISELLSTCRERIHNIATAYEVSFDSGEADSEAAQLTAANDHLKQVQLAEQIRNIAMLDGAHQHLSRVDSSASLLTALKQNISIIFGISHSILFIYDASDDTIQALSTSENDAYLDDIKIPLEQGRSIICDALLEQSSLNTFDEAYSDPTIIDRQLIGITQHEGLLCLPLIVNNAAVGTLVLGIDKVQLPLLLKQKGLIDRFSIEIANTISSTLGQFKTSQTLPGTDAESSMQARVREVVHEVRNPLSIINNYLDILRFKLETDDQAHQDLDTIKQEIVRITTILEKLTSPQEPDTESVRAVDVNALIADLTHVFQTSLFAANNVEISLNLDEQMPLMMTNPDAIKQVYTNLVKNAVEALPADGLVMVYTQDNVNVDGNAHYEICVADDGPGIPVDILPDLFTPIQTTKGGEHAGLGLTIVKNLVNELNGSISCRSSDRGTSFHILLPRITQE